MSDLGASNDQMDDQEDDQEIEQALDRALAEWLSQREEHADLLPSDFAQGLAPALRSAFLREIEALAAIDALASAPPRDLPQRFSDFRILGQLGQGATGVVYEAEQISLRRRVAIKVLHAHVAQDARLSSRFRREAQTVASLHHPGIVPVHAVGEHEGRTFLVMGLVDGRSLQRLLQAKADERDVDHARAKRLLGDRQALFTAMAETAEALHFAHERGVVHRDIKPANLLIDDEGHVLVLDFGLATTLSGDQATLTRTGDVLGTPVYMSPEQAAGEREVDGRCDIYSLGAVLYEALSGRTPIAPAPLPVLLERIRSAAPPPLASLVPALPKDVLSVVMRCLEKQRSRRYANAAALAVDLRRLVAKQPVEAKPVGPLGKLVRIVERRPRTWLAASLLVTLASFASWFAWNAENRADDLAVADEIRAIRQAMSLAPEGITALGGASMKWYRTLGLCESFAAATTTSSPAATALLARTMALAERHPANKNAQRLLGSVGMDIGNRAGLAAAHAAFARLESFGMEPRDRAAQALLDLIEGKHEPAERAFVALANEQGPEVEYSRALWYQVRQDYARSILAFDKVLESRTLPEEQRYFALLHRGWCRTCPETRDLVRAKDDLHSAMALRPDYATPRLLWGGLRLLEPDDSVVDPTLQEVARVLKSVEHAPWVVRLTACVLLAFAEGSADLDGPCTFLTGITPLAATKVAAGRRDSLVATAQSLLESIPGASPKENAARESVPDDLDAQMLLVVSATLQRRFSDAEARASRIARANPSLGDVLHAKLALARGRSGSALEIVDRVLARDSSSVPAWLLRADLVRRRGDARGEIEALRKAGALAPPDAPILPHIAARLVATLIAIGEPGEAEQALTEPRFLAPSCGGQGHFATQTRAQQAKQLAALRINGGVLGEEPSTRVAGPDLERAREAALRRSSESGDARVEHAALLFVSGELRAAHNELERALASDPADLRIRALLAVVAAREKDTALARSILRDQTGRARLDKKHLHYLVASVPAPLDERFLGELAGLLD